MEILEGLYKTTKINNRRYLGNKYKLLEFIRNTVDNNCKNINVFADLFAGTGSVSSAFTDKVIITNDLLYSNYICNYAWFGSEEYNKEKIIDLVLQYNSYNDLENNYMTDNFSNTFFCSKDCSKIGFIREDIEKRFNNNEINFREKALLITSLLYAMDKVANTCGHYEAYFKNAGYDKTLELFVPLAEINNNKLNICYNQNINDLVSEISADIVYLDPPYNSRQYCDAYHLLENVATWNKPKVYGVAKKMNRDKLKSEYCSHNANIAFENLIDNLKSKYILLSYNNMGNKGNERSNAKISDDDIIRILEKKGSLKVFSQEYKPFTTGKSNINENEERLFLCECK